MPLQSTSSAHLPVEIIEQVIDELQDDIASLQSTAQTCHSLLPLCRRHIFASINLTPPPTWDIPRTLLPPALLFQRLLDRNPDVGHYVRDLTLTLYINHSHTNTRLPSGLETPDTHICLSLKKLPHLQKLEITGGYPHTYNIHTMWHSISPHHRQSLLDCIHSASLTELRITNFQLPIPIFRSCPNLIVLKSLSLRKWYEEEFADMDPPLQPISIPQLRSLEFRGQFIPKVVSSRHNNGYPILRFHKLKTLIAQGDETEEVQAIAEILKEATELEDFTYMVNGSPRGFRGCAGWINSSAFSTLKTFKVVCNSMENEDPLRFLCEELETFPHTNVLETLHINVDVETDNLFTTGSEWGRLDTTLSRGFSALRRLSIRIVIWIYQERPEIKTLREELADVPQKQFPWLSKNPAVQFDFSSRVDYV